METRRSSRADPGIIEGTREEPERAIVDWAVRYIAETLALDHVAFLELLPDGDSLVLRAAVGWPEAMLGETTLPLKFCTQLSHALTGVGPYAISSVRMLSRTERGILVPGTLRGSAVLLPVRLPERPLGVVGAFASRSRPFTEDEMAVLTIVADVLESLTRSFAGVE